MVYFTDLFSPETYEAFARSSRDVSGFRIRHRKMAERVATGDRFICYLTRLSRWFGVLEVLEGPFIDNKAIFVSHSESSSPGESAGSASQWTKRVLLARRASVHRGLRHPCLSQGHRGGRNPRSSSTRPEAYLRDSALTWRGKFGSSLGPTPPRHYPNEREVLARHACRPESSR